MRFIMMCTVALLALAGCTATGEEGSASIYVKDAPTDDFDEIHVAFTMVEVHQAATDSDGWITVYENETGQDIDLLNASGARAAFLGEANLTEGHYTQIRITSNEAYGIAGGQRSDFDMAPTPFKIVRSFNVTAGEETRIVLDFDLDRSIIQQGPNGYRMTPVIGKTMVEQVDGDSSGDEAHKEGEMTTV